MTEIVLVAVIALLLIHDFSTQRQFLNHLKDLEYKLAGMEGKGKVETPNEIAENHYRDISDVNPDEVIK
jgi:hypothetical protein